MEAAGPPNEIDLAKAAVIIDCEGNININGGPRKRYYELQVTVGNKEFVILEWCKAHFGGHIYTNTGRRDPRGPKYAPARRWRLANADAADFLAECLRHFIAKREQAEIGVHFWKIYGPSRSKTSETDRMLCEELRLRLRSLTRRGPRPLPEPTKPKPEPGLFAA
jgi:hypothetical protein